MISSVVAAALQAHVDSALARINATKYGQEPAFISALIARLDGVVYSGHDGFLEIRGVVVDDRGRNSAESRFGADFSITACLTLADGSLTEKAVLGQAKRGTLEALSTRESTRLSAQIGKLRSVTRHYVVVELPLETGDNLSVRPSRSVGGHHLQRGTSLGSYMANSLLACKHGDTRSAFVSSVASSNLSGLKITYRS